MQQYIGQMMPAGREAIKLVIEHVREDRQRDTIAQRSVGQCLGEAAAGQAPLDLRILEDEQIVVVVEKIEKSVWP